MFVFLVMGNKTLLTFYFRFEVLLRRTYSELYTSQRRTNTCVTASAARSAAGTSCDAHFLFDLFMYAISVCPAYEIQVDITPSMDTVQVMHVGIVLILLCDRIDLEHKILEILSGKAESKLGR